MTCIVALEHPNGVVLGTDSFWGNDVVKDIQDHSKFFKKGPKFYMAGAGDTRPGQIVEHELKFRRKKKDETDEAYLVNHVVKKMREAFAKMEDERNVEDKLDWDFLVVLAGKAYVIDDEFSVGRSKNGFAAIGAASPFVLGAVAALIEIPGTPIQKVTNALKAAAMVSSTCLPPYHVINV